MTGEYSSALSAVLMALNTHLSDCDVTADVTEFTFKQLLHDSTQPRDGKTLTRYSVLSLTLSVSLSRVATRMENLEKLGNWVNSGKLWFVTDL